MLHLASINGKKLSRPILNRDAFNSAFASFSGSACCVVEVGEEGIWRKSDILPAGIRDAWSAFCNFLDEQKLIYIHGDCWHFALALHRLYGLEPGFVRVANKKLAPGELGVDHVVGLLPDGRLVDVLGVHEDLESFRVAFNGVLALSGAPPRKKLLLAKDSIEKIETILDYWFKDNSNDSGENPPIWNDPTRYAFAATTNAYAELLVGSAVRQCLARPDPRMDICGSGAVFS
jgi:hypothetical protein